MKKVILILMFVISWFFSNAQLQVNEVPKLNLIGKVNSGLYLRAKLEYAKSDIDETQNVYYLTYQDMSYTQLLEYKYIKFYGNQELVNQLYDVIKAGFDSENIKEYEKMLRLGNDDVYIRGIKMMGVQYIILKRGTSNVSLTKSQWQKVFAI